MADSYQGVLYLDSDHRVTVRFQDADGNRYTTATVKLTLYDDAGSEVSGQTWPLTLSYEEWTDEDGNARQGYRGRLEDEADVYAGTIYEAEVVIDAGGLDRSVFKKLLCQKHYV